jgi:hypothetical protein
MAQINIVQPKAKVTKGKEGGGKKSALLGAGLGALLAGAATVATGGAALPVAAAALVGAGGGMGLGSLLGEAVSPTKQATVEQKNPVTGMQTQMGGGAAKLEQARQQLEQAMVAMKSQPDSIRQEFSQPLIESYADIMARMNSKNGVV